MNDLQRLKEMGITVWDIRNPACFPELAPQRVTLPADCQLLLVSQSAPNAQEAALFGKVLASMKLSADDALYLAPQALPLLSEHQLAWVWFAGVEPSALNDGAALNDEATLKGVKTLTSPSLSALEHDQAAKKALWQQIKSYES